MNKIFLLSFSMLVNVVQADLVSIDDFALSKVDGEGIGLVLEDFIFNAGSETAGGGTIEISGLKGSSGQDVSLHVSQFYILGNGSIRGSVVDGNSTNIGRLSNPFNIELIDGDDVGVANKAVFEFSAPKLHGTTSVFTPTFFNQIGSAGDFTGFNTALFDDDTTTGSRSSERPDIGISVDLEIAAVRTQSLNTHYKRLSIDGSRLRLWGSYDDDVAKTGGRMEGELTLNIYTHDLEFFACNSGDSFGDNSCGTSIHFNDFAAELQLGWGSSQPATFEVNGDGNFVFEIKSLEGICGGANTGIDGCTASSGDQSTDVVERFYSSSGPFSNIYMGEVKVGERSFGNSTISNLQIEYLKVSSHDL